jgi:hypothetical protein
MPAARRFSPPWMIQEHAESFIVPDKTDRRSSSKEETRHYRFVRWVRLTGSTSWNRSPSS